jgi:putative membrane protein
MRLIRILVAMLCLVAGVAVGALNPQVVEIDLGLAVLRPTLGVALLATLLLGAVAGGLAIMASVVLPLRQRRRGDATRAPNMDAN